jgi:Flp pilus assembly protein TadG
MFLPRLARRAASTARRRAAATVEFAVVSPVLVVLVLGIVEFGRAMMTLELLNNAARNGSRVGVLIGADDVEVKAAVDKALKTTGIKGTTTILVNDAAGNPRDAKPGDSITVKIVVPYKDVAWLPTSIWLGDKHLSSVVAMRKE